MFEWKSRENMLIKSTPGVTNLFAQSANVVAKGVWHNQFQQHHCAQFYKKTQLEVMHSFYTVSSTPCASKTSLNLLAQKLLIESW